jgi:hypothetical protein
MVLSRRASVWQQGSRGERRSLKSSNAARIQSRIQFAEKMPQGNSGAFQEKSTSLKNSMHYA